MKKYTSNSFIRNMKKHTRNKREEKLRDALFFYQLWEKEHPEICKIRLAKIKKMLNMK